jgi:hypothetical protein
VALELAPCFAEVVGLDAEPEMLLEARRATPDEGTAKVRWVRGTAMSPPERFGGRLGEFRAELSDALRQRTDTGAFWWWPGDSEVLIAGSLRTSPRRRGLR